MQNSIFGIFLLIILNTVPNKVENFKVYPTEDKDKILEFTWNANNDRWDVENKDEQKTDNWLKEDEGYFIVGANEEIDTIDYSIYLPEYKNIKWNKTKSLDIEGGKIHFKKKRKNVVLTLEDEFSSAPMEILVEW